ncbi:hypothetical protein QVD17_41566 [Tagetes erecta]|uniref:Uncharacterized protein n=1 Tax=Tagetes erecta TaxID=13708 RepID=A0AAD8JMQ8_TARER|nr:hypothetical protein QVD17_41566 [Tagetes erecta]
MLHWLLEPHGYFELLYFQSKVEAYCSPTICQYIIWIIMVAEAILAGSFMSVYIGIISWVHHILFPICFNDCRVKSHLQMAAGGSTTYDNG